MKAQLAIFILLLTISCKTKLLDGVSYRAKYLYSIGKRGSCVTQTAVEGVSTNIAIQCDLVQQMAAPFWRINDHVYDIFHVPAYFRVGSYITLTIPEVSRSINNYTFQCILIDHTTDPIREIHGTLTELTVNENTNYNMILEPLYSGTSEEWPHFMKFY